MNCIPNWFHFYDTTESFNVHKKQGLISSDSICFLNETGQIYTQNAFFGICRERFEKLEQLVLEHTAKINNILGIEGPSVEDGIVNNIADLIRFLDGFTDQDNLKDFIESIKSILVQQIEEVRIELLDKIVNNKSAISEINSQISSIKDKLDSHSEDITYIGNMLSEHISQYIDLKDSYETFKSYVATEFTSVKDSISSLSKSLNNTQEYVEELDEKFDLLENEVAVVRDYLEEAKQLVEEIKDVLNNISPLTEEEVISVLI